MLIIFELLFELSLVGLLRICTRDWDCAGLGRGLLYLSTPMSKKMFQGHADGTEGDEEGAIMGKIICRKWTTLLLLLLCVIGNISTTEPLDFLILYTIADSCMFPRRLRKSPSSLFDLTQNYIQSMVYKVIERGDLYRESGEQLRRGFHRKMHSQLR